MNSNSRWLHAHAANRYSQFGEDGIIEKILMVIGEPVGWCVEFGAWDGRHLSNTYALIEHKGFSAVLIEGSAERFSELQSNFKKNPRVIPVNAFVGFEKRDGLDQILAATPIPQEFDLLSIDIDGNDFHAWKAVERYQPRVVVAEYNPTIPTAVDFVQAPDMSVSQGSSIRAFVRLGEEKGFKLVCITDRNCIFVKDRYFDLFEIGDNSPESLRPNESLVTWVFCGFDGTVFVRGHGKLPWHGVPYREEKMQPVARLFRKFPGNDGPLMRFVSRQYRTLKKRRWL